MMDCWTRGHSIGHGSTATVSLATSTQSGQVFAVKSAELSQSEFLQREQKILSSISSPYIVSYKGCDITREHSKVMYNILMEYVAGGTLTDEIRACGGRLEESVIGHYTWQILQGLNYLHLNELVHCDIKGRNILVGHDDGVKIADFGCAKRVRVDPIGVDDVVARIGGTPMFMAPEVARGEEQGFACDIWALGCTIIEMASGGPPWPNANDPVSVMYRVGYSGDLPEFPCCLSEQAKDFLDKCLRRDPKERWTASQLLKHPFLEEEFNSDNQTKQLQESKSSSPSSSNNSPTSILDQGFWDSLDESSGSLENLARPSPACDRIRRLSLLSCRGPSWDWDESWITIRESCSEEEVDGTAMDDDVEVKDLGGEMLGLLDRKIKNINSTRTCFCKYGKDTFVISNSELDRDKPMLFLIPSTSKVTVQT